MKYLRYLGTMTKNVAQEERVKLSTYNKIKESLLRISYDILLNNFLKEK